MFTAISLAWAWRKLTLYSISNSLHSKEWTETCRRPWSRRVKVQEGSCCGGRGCRPCTEKAASRWSCWYSPPESAPLSTGKRVYLTLWNFLKHLASLCHPYHRPGRSQAVYDSCVMRRQHPLWIESLLQTNQQRLRPGLRYCVCKDPWSKAQAQMRALNQQRRAGAENLWSLQVRS